ncbi:hypothetical protein Y032_0140g2190 [Ancylostoma ceylanicum]|uniref:Uncharacterized protein n=1 Tax=Ancylostoma ceylanicum TaxID=53326 RepID=A0A016T4B5_9BILA|nr:hypothetical protein Y032_0140g2190 [Ancylostoma ceylanicum]
MNRVVKYLFWVESSILNEVRNVIPGKGVRPSSVIRHFDKLANRRARLHGFSGYNAPHPLYWVCSYESVIYRKLRRFMSFCVVVCQVWMEFWIIFPIFFGK